MVRGEVRRALHGRKAADIDDAVQHIWYKVLSSKTSEVRYPRAWLRTVAKHEAERRREQLTRAARILRYDGWTSENGDIFRIENVPQ